MGPAYPTSEASGKSGSLPGDAGVTPAGGNWKVVVAPAYLEATSVVEGNVVGSVNASESGTKANTAAVGAIMLVRDRKSARRALDGRLFARRSLYIRE